MGAWEQREKCNLPPATCLLPLSGPFQGPFRAHTMRQRVTLLFVQDDQILLFYRFREGRSYYILPGGGIEPGETIAQAALREGQEETGLHFRLGPLLWERELQVDPDYRLHEFAFLVTEFSGTPVLGGPELADSGPENVYCLEWHPLAQVNEMVHYPRPVDVTAVYRALNMPMP